MFTIVFTYFPPIIKLEDHPLLAVGDFLFKIFVTILSGYQFLHSQHEEEHIILKGDPRHEFIF